MKRKCLSLALALTLCLGLLPVQAGAEDELPKLGTPTELKGGSGNGRIGTAER